MKEVRDTIKEVQYRRLLKRSFEPRKEFVERSRAAFLEEVAKRRVAPLAPQIHWRPIGVSSLRYAAAFAAIALLSTSGLVAFADNTNVSVSSPLYPLKLIGEQVRLVAVPAAQEPTLREELAQRRASELSEVETKQQPDNNGGVEQLRKLETKETELRSDFRKNIEKIEEHSIKERADNPLPTVIVNTSLCQAAQIVERHGSDEKSEQYKQFEDRCKTLLGTPTDLIQAPTPPVVIQNSSEGRTRPPESGRRRGDSIQSVTSASVIQNNTERQVRSSESGKKGGEVIRAATSTPVIDIRRDSSVARPPEPIKQENIRKQESTRSEEGHSENRVEQQ